MTDDSDYLFVYGTLRPGFNNSFAQFLRQHGRYVGDACFPGLLFDIGPYPGATYQPHCPTTVQGSVYTMAGHKHTLLTYLDDYEGVGDSFSQPTEYVRAVIPVRCTDVVINCWVYLYNWPTTRKPIIQSGDYLRYSPNE